MGKPMQVIQSITINSKTGESVRGYQDVTPDEAGKIKECIVNVYAHIIAQQIMAEGLTV